MTARFTLRLLDADNTLLAWTEITATAKPQIHAGSCPFWADEPIQFLIERDGIAARVSYHWRALDVARVVDLNTPCAVKAGETRTPVMLEPVWLVPGMRDVPLPSVTVRESVTISPPVGAMGATSPG